jgi:hypothetical protein
MARTWAMKLFDRNSTAEMPIAIATGIGARFVRGARHPERNFAPSLNVNAPSAQLLELRVRYEQLHKAIVIGFYLLQ